MTKAPKTSLTHPLQIAEVSAPGGGTVGITFCPGKFQQSAFSGAWARDLRADVKAIRDWGGDAVVTLVTERELADLRVADLGSEVVASGMQWLHLPIIDVSVPTAEWDERWANIREGLHASLTGGGKVLVHCKGGLGRAGTVAARILVERGVPPREAVEAVRQVRPGAIETGQQEAYVHALVPAAISAGGRAS
jgi:protein-tyrosine phosphatase